MKKMVFRVIALLINLGVALIFLDSFLRINPKFGYNYSSSKFKNDKINALTEDNFGYIRPSALLGYEIIPNCNHGMPVASNSFGLIGKEYKLNKDNNTFRILLLGDSIAWVNVTREFLEEKLNNNLHLNPKYKFEIWNASCPSYDVRRYALFLKYKGLKYTPDMIMIFLFMNDFDTNISVYYKNKDGLEEYYFPLPEILKKYTVNPFLMKHSYLYRFVILRLDSYLLSMKKKKDVQPQEDDGKYYLGMIKDICIKNNLPLLVIIFPYLKPFDEYKDWQKKQYKIICNVVKGLKIKHINLYEYFKTKDLYSFRETKGDDIHPSCEGERIISDTIYNYILDNHLIKT